SAAHSAAEAKQRLIDNYQEQGRRALLDGDAHAALMFLNQAYQMGADGAGLRFMLGRALAPVEAETATLPHGARLWSTAFTPDGGRVLTAGDDGVVRGWGVATGRAQLAPARHRRSPLRRAASPDGAPVATRGRGGGRPRRRP